MKRVAILGNSGTGKSRLARILGGVLQLPVVHLDRHYWLPGWTEPPREDWLRTHRRLVHLEGWIMDGNYGGSMEERLEAADTAILLEAPRLVSLYRVWRRSLTHLGRRRPELGPGCPERLPTRGFFAWIWGYPEKARPAVLKRLERFARRGGTVFYLRDQRAVSSFLRRVAK